MGFERDFARVLGQIRGAWGDRGLWQPLNSGSYILIPYLNNVTKRPFPLKNREQKNTEPKLELVRQWPTQFRVSGRARTDRSRREQDPGGAVHRPLAGPRAPAAPRARHCPGTQNKAHLETCALEKAQAVGSFWPWEGAQWV